MSTKILGFSFSDGNRKMGCIPSFSLLPIFTCAVDAPCKQSCYACKTAKLYKNTYKAWSNNFEILKADDGFNNLERAFDVYFTMYNPLLFRFHVGGDVFSVDYLKIINKIANKHKRTKFLLFTKQYKMFNEYFTENKKPKNLKIVFSQWLDYPMENIHNFPVAVYQPDKKAKIKSGFVCGGNCFECKHCWNMRKGQKVIFFKH